MKNTKYVMMGGFAFSENSDMEKLKRFAKEGWIIDGVSLPILSYRLKKGKPQNLDFAVDYQSGVDEDYFSLFESAGWRHEATIGDEIHIFSAPEGTKPIYTDKTSEIDKLKTIGDKFKYPSMYSMILLAIMIVINIFAPQEGMLHYGIIGITILVITASIFTGMPYIGYQYRLKNIKRHILK